MTDALLSFSLTGEESSRDGSDLGAVTVQFTVDPSSGIQDWVYQQSGALQHFDITGAHAMMNGVPVSFGAEGDYSSNGEYYTNFSVGSFFLTLDTHSPLQAGDGNPMLDFYTTLNSTALPFGVYGSDNFSGYSLQIVDPPEVSVLEPAALPLLLLALAIVAWKTKGGWYV